MSRANETRFIEWHETCKCKCRLYAIVCNNKQCFHPACDVVATSHLGLI